MTVHKKSFLLAVKLTVIRPTEAGEHQLDISKALDVTGWTVKSILKNGDKSKECGKMAAPCRALKLNNTLCLFYDESDFSTEIYLVLGIKLLLQHKLRMQLDLWN
jgi:hypothetical protein